MKEIQKMKKALVAEKTHMMDMDYMQSIIKKDNIKPTKRDWGLAYRIPLT